MKSKKKKVIVIGVVVILVAVSTILIFGRGKKQPKVALQQVAVGIADISSYISATGTIEPTNKVEVGTQVSGKIETLYVDYNSVVKKGQVLAELDRENLQNELTAKQNNLESAKTEYEYKKKNHERNKALHEQKLISDSEYETSLYEYSKALTNYKTAQTELAKSKTNLAYATIYSPIDGVVISRAVEQGQTVAASFSTPTLFTIAQDLTQMQVVADVDEADIGQVKEGQRVTFTVDAYPDEVFEGKVKQVRLEATTTSNVVTYACVIDAPNAEGKLMPGLTANVNIYTNESKGVLSIPTKALSFTPPADLLGKDYTIEAVMDDKIGKHVWVLQGKRLYAKQVKVGMSGGGLTEVVSGLKQGEKVVGGLETSLSTMPKADEQGAKGAFSMPRPGDKKKKQR